jgi:hypothetical protein
MAISLRDEHHREAGTVGGDVSRRHHTPAWTRVEADNRSSAAGPQTTGPALIAPIMTGTTASIRDGRGGIPSPTTRLQ